MNDMLVDLKIRKNTDGTEEVIRELYSNVFNPMINEGFFADKVVVVEGPSEQYSLPIYSDILGYNLDRNNVSVVHSDGKGEMDRVLRVFNGFKIPTYLWFDGDKPSNDSGIKNKTLELLELLGDPISKIEDLETKITDRYTVLENKLETTLSNEIKDYENLMEEAGIIFGQNRLPLKHRYIARKLKKRVDNSEPYEEVLPKTIIEIVENVKNLSYFGSILKK
jgi:predicted ATP-dependent endonuclease of OLD family